MFGDARPTDVSALETWMRSHEAAQQAWADAGGAGEPGYPPCVSSVGTLTWNVMACPPGYSAPCCCSRHVKRKKGQSMLYACMYGLHVTGEVPGCLKGYLKSLITEKWRRLCTGLALYCCCACLSAQGTGAFRYSHQGYRSMYVSGNLYVFALERKVTFQKTLAMWASDL